jgi:PEP-CTERM motif
MAATPPTLPGQSSTCAAIILAVAGLCWGTPKATADPILSPPTFQTNISGNGTGTANAWGMPTASAYAQGTATTLQGEGASAVTRYEFGVAGPAGNTIPLTLSSFVSYDVVGALTTGLNATGYTVNAEVDLVGQVVNDLSGSNSAVGPLSASQANVYNFSVISGLTYDVQVSASLSVNNTFNSAVTTVTAFADPMISFGPGFNSTGYTLEFSPGIGNAGPFHSPQFTTPEPSSLTLLASFAAAGLLGHAWRRRKSVTA